MVVCHLLLQALPSWIVILSTAYLSKSQLESFEDELHGQGYGHRHLPIRSKFDCKISKLPKASSSMDATNYNNNDVLSLLLSTFPVERAWWMIYRWPVLWMDWSSRWHGGLKNLSNGLGKTRVLVSPTASSVRTIINSPQSIRIQNRFKRCQ